MPLSHLCGLEFMEKHKCLNSRLVMKAKAILFVHPTLSLIYLDFQDMCIFRIAYTTTLLSPAVTMT